MELRTVRRSQRDREIAEQAAETARRLGRVIRAARKRRHWTQAQLGERVGLSQSEVCRIELGTATRAPLETWIALALALGLRSRFELGRDTLEEPADAGHLAIQELLLRQARATGCSGTFELPIGRGDPAHSVDVFVRDDARRRLIVEEAWNTIGDIGAGARSFDRKLALAADLAIAIGGERPYGVHGVWVVRASARNRALVARYPELFARRFPGSSREWVATLRTGSPPPSEPGLVWSDVPATRVFEWRRPDYSTTTPVRSSADFG